MATGPGSVSPESRFSEDTEVRGMRSLCICNKTDVDDGRLRLLEHDKDDGGRDPATKKSAKAGDAGMEVMVGSEAIFAELGGNQCRRRNVTKDATEKSTDNKMVSFSDNKTKEQFDSNITTTTTGNNITTTTTGKTALETTGTTSSDGETGNNITTTTTGKTALETTGTTASDGETGNNITTTTTGKTALETTGTTASDGETGNNITTTTTGKTALETTGTTASDGETGNNITTTTTGKTALETTGTTASGGQTGNNPDEKSRTITPQSGADGASPTPPSDDIAPMLCMQCRSPVGRKFVVPAKVNLLRCESKLDELIQKVDGHLRRLSTSLYEIVALEYALTQDGATGETIRKYGPLLLANRYAYLASDMEADGDLGSHSRSRCSCEDENDKCRGERDDESGSSECNFTLLAGVHDTALAIALSYLRAADQQQIGAVNAATTETDMQRVCEYMNQLNLVTSVTAPVTDAAVVDKDDDDVYDGDRKAARAAVLREMASSDEQRYLPFADIRFLEQTLTKSRRLVSLLQQDESTWWRFALSGSYRLKLRDKRHAMPYSLLKRVAECSQDQLMDSFALEVFVLREQERILDELVNRIEPPEGAIRAIAARYACPDRVCRSFVRHSARVVSDRVDVVKRRFMESCECQKQCHIVLESRAAS